MLYRNHVRVWNVRNIGNVRNMFGSRLFGTCWQHQQTQSKIIKSRYVQFWRCQFCLGFFKYPPTSPEPPAFSNKVSYQKSSINYHPIKHLPHPTIHQSSVCPSIHPSIHQLRRSRTMFSGDGQRKVSQPATSQPGLSHLMPAILKI